MDLPNYDEPRFIYLGKDEGNYIVLPRGLRDEILKRFDKAGIPYDIEDKRTDGRRINVSFKGKLRESQIPAVQAMLENETGILHAGTGKTVVTIFDNRKIITGSSSTFSALGIHFIKGQLHPHCP